METKSNKGIVVLLVIIMVVLVLGIVFLIFQNNELKKGMTTKVNSSKTTELKDNGQVNVNKLNNDDLLVKLLANQVESNLNSNNGYYYENGYLFKNKKITIDDLSALDKFAIALKSINPGRVSITDCGSFSNAYRLNNSGIIQGACNSATDKGSGKASAYLESINKGVEEVLDFNYNELKSTYELMFNQKLTNNVSFDKCGYMCKYDAASDNMFCSFGSCGGTSPLEAYAVADYAMKYDDYVELYDYYAIIDHSDQGIYLRVNDLNEVDKNSKVGTYNGAENIKVPDETIKKYGQLYKHTFKLNSTNGLYYWYSSEPVNK